MFVQGGIPLVEPHSEWFWVVSTCFVIFPFDGKLTNQECWTYPDGHAQMHFFNGHCPTSGLIHFRSCFLPFCSLGITGNHCFNPQISVYPADFPFNQSIALSKHTVPQQVVWNRIFPIKFVDVGGPYPVSRHPNDIPMMFPCCTMIFALKTE